jgi:hypothetical protein
MLSAGGGLLITPLTAMVTAGVRESEAGAASGLMNTTKQVGGALGLAALATIAASSAQTPQALAGDHGRAFLTIAPILVAVAGAARALPPRRDVARARADAG